MREKRRTCLRSDVHQMENARCTRRASFLCTRIGKCSALRDAAQRSTVLEPTVRSITDRRNLARRARGGAHRVELAQNDAASTQQREENPGFAAVDSSPHRPCLSPRFSALRLINDCQSLYVRNSPQSVPSPRTVLALLLPLWEVNRSISARGTTWTGTAQRNRQGREGGAHDFYVEYTSRT